MARFKCVDKLDRICKLLNCRVPSYHALQMINYTFSLDLGLKDLHPNNYQKLVKKIKKLLPKFILKTTEHGPVSNLNKNNAILFNLR